MAKKLIFIKEANNNNSSDRIITIRFLCDKNKPHKPIKNKEHDNIKKLFINSNRRKIFSFKIKINTFSFEYCLNLRRQKYQYFFKKKKNW